MDSAFYLEKFQEASNRLDGKTLSKRKLEVAVGIYVDSVFLKLYKKSWANESEDALTAESRIFFSVWVSDGTINQQKIFYNIHALKLRKLKIYSIESRKFAEAFRKKFKSYEKRWENVSTKFGPLTLMEGWIKLEPANFVTDIEMLAKKFYEIEYLVDETLLFFKK